MDKIRVVKMHGNGNDFIIVDEFNGVVVPDEQKSDIVKAICHRRFGIGADGAIFVQKSEVADAKFVFYNNDGSIAEMCGNGIRCFARYLVEEGYAKEKIKVETLAGILELDVIRDGWWVRVDMGKPKFGLDVPAKEEVWGKVFNVDGRKFKVYAVNTGVPHAVVFVNDFDFDLIKIARAIRYHDVFPQGTNVNFAKVLDRGRVIVRTYERGVEDETLSCGTGSCAVAVVGYKLGILDKNVEVLTRGGVLKIEVNDRIYMTGTATRVLDGWVNLKELKLPSDIR
jgi:diaminopimelate epimerase